MFNTDIRCRVSTSWVNNGVICPYLQLIPHQIPAALKFRINTEQEVNLGSLSYTQIMEAERRHSPRTMSLTLSYNFGKMEQKKRWGRGREGDHGGGGMMDMDY